MQICSCGCIFKDLYLGLDEPDLTSGLGCSCDGFLELHSEFVAKLLDLTPRPTATVVEAAVLEACSASCGLAASFGKTVATSVSYGRQQTPSTKDGSKLPSSTLSDCAKTEQKIVKQLYRAMASRR